MTTHGTCASCRYSNPVGEAFECRFAAPVPFGETRFPVMAGDDWCGEFHSKAQGETIKAIAEVVAQEHGMTLEQMMSGNRRRKFAHARQDAMRRIHIERPDLSLPQIGDFFGKDHTTVIYGIRASEAREKKQREVAQ